MKRIKLSASDGSNISVNVWDGVLLNKVGGVYISHGMAEHPDRYDRLAKKLNSLGYIVLADDHRGHRLSAAGKNGQVEGDSFNQTVEDMRMIIDYMKRTYGVKVALLGHSYGSFLAQAYLERYSSTIQGAILSGTAYMKSPLLAMGYLIASVQKLFLGGKKTGNLINTLSFGSYGKPFKSQGQQFAWLSRDKQEVDKYEKDPDCGYAMSIGFFHSFFKGILSMYGKNVNNIKKELPILIAVGSDDPVSRQSKDAKKLYDYYKKAGLNAELKIYPGARHEILNETNREEVSADMIAFINKLF
ncbi:MAG: lysophospholipase [Christensenellales bacterium]|jgi:alpha-beta hydrolase superfamily lysophospholipase